MVSASKLARKLAEVERVPLDRFVVSSSCRAVRATLAVEVATASGPSSLSLKAEPAPTSRLWVTWSPSASVTVARSTSAPAAVVSVEVSSLLEVLAW